MGGMLNEAMVKRKTLTEFECLKIIQNLLKGLAYLAKNDIMHRDVKPPNIVLRTAEDIYDIVLVDMGFAIKIEDSIKDANSDFCVGSPGYIAPEMLRGLPFDCKADVFSAGATLYIMMAFRPAFYSHNRDNVIKLNRQCQPDFRINEWPECNYNYTEEILELLELMLKREPKERPTAQQCLDHEAFKLL